jgi:hypothetical protein
VTFFFLIDTILYTEYYNSFWKDIKMAKKKKIKIDPNKVKKEELQGVFTKVLDKLKSS